ncbi:hypothetical protein [Mycolicibacterium sphagni]|uniref:Uncharacterized protein n=1 Tax=Mycolicibacterium sphagni TaxID=1786 RepID=A0A255DU77_9MYCO|nr:hypothetical protein [Mycolicibacterium sphagni]MCV7178276.1 hypothetical protein [Mycolicibacterium sphagni]OYN79193.1 hypothetical protein CG716_12550 [Mycolicibacterium sphagni]
MDGGNNGDIHDVPWASIFDPAANMRALTSVQAEGFRAASELVDRFVRMVATRPDGGAAAVRQASPLSDEQRADFLGATDVEPLIRSWWAMAGQFLMGGAPQTQPATAATSPALDFTGSAASGRLEFETEVGDSATAEVWLHNSADGDLGRICLRCSELMAHDGSVIEAAAARLDPKVVPMPGRSSRGIAVTVKATKKTKPGVYRGTILVEGRPELWLPVALTVRPPSA